MTDIRTTTTITASAVGVSTCSSRPPTVSPPSLTTGDCATMPSVVDGRSLASTVDSLLHADPVFLTPTPLRAPTAVHASVSTPDVVYPSASAYAASHGKSSSTTTFLTAAPYAGLVVSGSKEYIASSRYVMEQEGAGSYRSVTTSPVVMVEPADDRSSAPPPGANINTNLNRTSAASTPVHVQQGQLLITLSRSERLARFKLQEVEQQLAAATRRMRTLGSKVRFVTVACRRLEENVMAAHDAQLLQSQRSAASTQTVEVPGEGKSSVFSSFGAVFGGRR